MQYLQFDEVDKLLADDPKLLESRIASWIVKQKERGVSRATIYVRLAAIKHFYTMNDVILNWKKLNKYLGDYTKKHQDRPYTKEEIAKIPTHCDLRMKAFILVMTSTGARIGALPDLKLRNLERIDKYRIYKITYYEGTKEEYYSFCTPECAIAISDYLKYREQYGEKLAKESSLK